MTLFSTPKLECREEEADETEEREAAPHYCQSDTTTEEAAEVAEEATEATTTDLEVVVEEREEGEEETPLHRPCRPLIGRLVDAGRAVRSPQSITRTTLPSLTTCSAKKSAGVTQDQVVRG